MKKYEILLAKKEYNLLGNLEDEIEAIGDFVDYGNSDMYVGDLIMEIADGYVPVYHGDIWENVKDIQEYIEEAMANGLAEGSDLIRTFMMGYYEFYGQSLYNNLDTMVYNIISDIVNDFLEGLTVEELKNINMEDIEEDIKELSEDFDNNYKMSHIEELAKKIIFNLENDSLYIKE